MANDDMFQFEQNKVVSVKFNGVSAYSVNICCCIYVLNINCEQAVLCIELKRNDNFKRSNISLL